MAKDERLYGRFTLDFADSPKIAPLSDLAFRTLVEMTLHSRRMLSDGFVDERIAKKKWKTRALAELLSNDPVKPSLIEISGGFLIHDFGEHQQTRADIEKKREAGRAGGKARAQAHASAGATAHAQASSKLTTETETETSTSNEVDRPRKRGSRLTEAWLPTSELVNQVRAIAPDVDLKDQTARFVDYWIAQPGQKGVKTDWDATWRNWMRKQQDETKPNRGRPTRTQETLSILEMGQELMGDQQKAVGQ